MNKLSFWGIFIIPVLWGVGFPLTHNAVQIVNPGYFAFYRQLIAAICLFPFAIKLLPQINKKMLLGSLFIGFWSSLNMLSQSFALSTISSSTTAFFVTLNILFVPFLLLFFGLSRLKILDIAAVALGLISIFVTFHGSLSAFSRGDIFGLIAAFSIAMNIITIQIMTKKAAVNRILLTFLSMTFGLVFLSYFPFAYSESLVSSPKIWIALLYQGCISTALAYLLQIMFQKQVGETRTAIILNLDLVFASLFGLINGEYLTVSQIVGGLLALLSSVLHDIVPLAKTKIQRLVVSLAAK